MIRRSDTGWASCAFEDVRRRFHLDVMGTELREGVWSFARLLKSTVKKAASEENVMPRSRAIMKSVVMIVHEFPPEGSAGVYRPLRFVRHLPSEGWRPVVIAGDPDCCQRTTPDCWSSCRPRRRL